MAKKRESRIQATEIKFLHSIIQKIKRDKIKDNEIRDVDHVESKIPKYEYHKIRERKVKTLTRNRRDRCWTGTRKLYRNISTGMAVFVNQKRANVFEHMTKMASLESL